MEESVCRCCGQKGEELDGNGLCLDCELMKQCRDCKKWFSMFDLDLSGYCINCWVEKGVR